MSSITYLAWLQVIPTEAWHWTLAGIVACVMPGDVLRQVVSAATDLLPRVWRK